jgi:MFS family permease
MDGEHERAATTTPHHLVPAVFGLGVTQMVGWGTSFSAMAVLGVRIAGDLELARETIFAGITIMLIVSGAMSPSCGRYLDKHGPRDLMAAGSLLGAIALTCMAIAKGPLLFWLGWVFFGAYVAMGLSNIVVPATVMLAGANARRAVTGLSIVGGTTSALFLPITAWLDAQFGWRMTLLIFAMLHLLVALPIVLAVLPPVRPEHKAAETTSDAPWKGIIPEHLHARAFWLIVAWSCLEGMLVWGFNMQSIDILRGAGLSTELAIAAWMFSGPCQALSRMIEFALAGRYPIMVTALLSVALAPIGFAVVFTLGLSWITAACLAIFYGLGHGLYTIARSMLPLRLFGLETYGATMGKIALPQSLCNAIAPIFYAALIFRAGAEWALAVSAAVTLGSFVAVVMLARTINQAEASSRP